MDESGRLTNRTIDDINIDLRESVFNFQEQQVFTKDTVLVDVDAVMYPIRPISVASLFLSRAQARSRALCLCVCLCPSLC